MIDIVVEAVVIGVVGLWTVLAVAVAEGERRGRLAGRLATGRERRGRPTQKRPVAVPFGHSRAGGSGRGYRFPEYPTRA
jgi:hypothetical protein